MGGLDLSKMMTNELEFARIVEEDLNLRNELYETTLQLSQQVDSFMGLFETFLVERNLWLEKEQVRNALSEQCCKSVQTEAISGPWNNAFIDKKDMPPKEPLLTKGVVENLFIEQKETEGDISSSIPACNALNQHQKKHGEVPSNQILVDLMFLDMKIRSTLKQNSRINNL
nr:unnamed protein product [Naegleria fowleri]